MRRLCSNGPATFLCERGSCPIVSIRWCGAAHRQLRQVVTPPLMVFLFEGASMFRYWRAAKPPPFTAHRVKSNELVHPDITQVIELAANSKSTSVDKRSIIMSMLIMALAGDFVGKTLSWDKQNGSWEGSREYLRNTNLDVITAEAIGGALPLHDRQPHGFIVRIELPIHQQSRLAAETTAARQVLQKLRNDQILCWEHKSDVPLLTDQWFNLAADLREKGLSGVLLIDDAHGHLFEVNELADRLLAADIRT
jgi:hypothetical protein